jgi:hypothetical protein
MDRRHGRDLGRRAPLRRTRKRIALDVLPDTSRRPPSDLIWSALLGTRSSSMRAPLAGLCDSLFGESAAKERRAPLTEYRIRAIEEDVPLAFNNGRRPLVGSGSRVALDLSRIPEQQRAPAPGLPPTLPRLARGVGHRPLRQVVIRGRSKRTGPPGASSEHGEASGIAPGAGTSNLTSRGRSHCARSPTPG